MEQRNATNEEFMRLKRERMGLKGNAGLISRARFDGVVAEGSDPRIRSRFAHILNGEMRDRIKDFDNHELSVLPAPVFDGRSPERRAQRSEETAMSRKQRMYQQKKQQHMNKAEPAPLPKDLAPIGGPRLSQEDAAILAQAGALFGETPRIGRNLPDISGRLLPERGNDLDIDLGGYGSTIPFDPINQIRSRATRRASSGVDYREMEAMSHRAEMVNDDENRYLSQTYAPQAPAYDERAMQAMARSMAEAMVKTVMQEHLDKNRGRKYFKEIKTNKDVFKDSPNSKLVEIDGKYYKMDLKPVKIKSNHK